MAPNQHPKANNTGRSLRDKCAMPKAALLAMTAAQTGMILVREVSRKPRKSVSSSKGAKTPAAQTWQTAGSQQPAAGSWRLTVGWAGLDSVHMETAALPSSVLHCTWVQTSKSRGTEHPACYRHAREQAQGAVAWAELVVEVKPMPFFHSRLAIQTSVQTSMHACMHAGTLYVVHCQMQQTDLSRPQLHSQITVLHCSL